MNWIRENWFKIAIIIALFIFVFSFKQYVVDKNEIEAEIGFFECMDKVGNANFCLKIKDYHNIEDPMGYLAQ